MLCLISSIVWQILCAIMKPTNCVLCQSPLWSASKAFLNITHRLNNCSPRLYFFIYFFLLKPIPPLLTSRHFALAYWGYTNITPWSELSQWWQYCWSRPALKEFISSMSRFAEHLTNQSSSWCRNDFLDFSLAVVWLHIIRAGNKHTHRSVKNVGSWFQNRYLWPSWSSQKAYLCKSVSDPTHFRPPWPKSENVLLFDGSHISILSAHWTAILRPLSHVYKWWQVGVDRDKCLFGCFSSGSNQNSPLPPTSLSPTAQQIHGTAPTILHILSLSSDLKISPPLEAGALMKACGEHCPGIGGWGVAGETQLEHLVAWAAHHPATAGAGRPQSSSVLRPAQACLPWLPGQKVPVLPATHFHLSSS